MTRRRLIEGTLPLFAEEEQLPNAGTVDALGEQAFVLRGFATQAAPHLFQALREVENQSPFRRMQTPGGFRMSVALTNCGRLGWISDANGYRYGELDPLTGRAWPAMPDVFFTLARAAATRVGFSNFSPDACLVNRYEPDSRLTLHQDRNERSLDAPIVSVSLGLPATFLFGGLTRKARVQRVPLWHGDVVVWGGVDRLRFHGVLPLKAGEHALCGARRFNFTLRCAG